MLSCTRDNRLSLKRPFSVDSQSRSFDITCPHEENLMSTRLSEPANSKGIRYFPVGFVDLFGNLRAKLVSSAGGTRKYR
jgi:hypothetical protein